jgi:nucleoside 2-deoxyribosyltransferase
MQEKLYLAGPEVFLPNATDHAEVQRQLCRKYGFVPLHPMDNNLDFGNRDMATAMRIYRGDIEGDFETCLKVLRADLDAGELKLF